MVKDKIYWESSCFLALLKKEKDRIRACQGTIDKAEKGELIIVTSAITFIEVVKLPGETPLKREAENTIRKFFENSFMSIREVDRQVGLIARDLMWRHEGLRPKDSIHIATAIHYKIPKLHSFDERHFLKLNNKYGNPKLTICEPDIDFNEQLEIPNEQEEK
jgi:predicted nucleic acid-binding protein